jgi:hypothetical protein
VRFHTRLRSARIISRTPSPACTSHDAVVVVRRLARRRPAFRRATSAPRLRASRRSRAPASPLTCEHRIDALTKTQDARNTSPQETCVVHGNSQQTAQSTTARSWLTRGGMRRSRSSCPARLRSAREFDLRSASPTFISQTGVELHFGVVLSAPGFHRSSLVQPRRASRRSPVAVLPPTCPHHTSPTQNSARSFCRKTAAIHKNLTFSTPFPRNARNPQPTSSNNHDRGSPFDKLRVTNVRGPFDKLRVTEYKLV